MSDAILDLGVAALARAIAEGAVTSVAATEAVLAALDGRGRQLNAVARLERGSALAAAERADLARARGKKLGPLHGVPLAYKDMFYRAGWKSECGTPLFRDFHPGTTATVLARLDAAGAVDCGRLNMVEIALGITGHNAHTGHPKNVWDEGRITGGSTSGGATAVAARLVPATLGSDTGGSARVPAALCNLVGLKPTYGRVSRHGAMPLSVSLDHIGPLARSAEDCALLLEVIAGADAQDPTTSGRQVPVYRAALAHGVAGLRLGVVEADYGCAVEPEVAAALRGAMDSFKGLGVGVEPVGLADFAPLNALRRVLMLAEAASLHRELVAARREIYNPQTLVRMEPGFALSAVDYGRALAARGVLLERFCAVAFAAVDVLALPTAPSRTPGIIETDTGGDARFLELANALGALVGPFNYLGLPAVSVPMGFDDRGMPMGLQLVGRPFAEALLLRLAHAFERVTGFTSRRPPS